MKDFLGSFAEGLGNLVRAYLFPSVIAVALWDFFILGIAKRDKDTFYADLRAIDGTNELLVVAGAALGVSMLLGVLTPTATRWLEGYWWGRHQTSGLLHRYWTWRVQRHHRRRKSHIQAVIALTDPPRELSAAERARLSRHQDQLRRYPQHPAPTMPTRLGNILRAGEEFGKTRYGLDTISMWDPLIACVPASVAQTQADRRTVLDLFVSTAVLPVVLAMASLHPVISTSVTWKRFAMVVLIGAVVSVLSYVAAVEAGKSYADSIAALVQVGRVPLAAALGITLPPTHDEERELWHAVTGFTFWGENASRVGGWLAVLDRHRKA